MTLMRTVLGATLWSCAILLLTGHQIHISRLANLVYLNQPELILIGFLLLLSLVSGSSFMSITYICFFPIMLLLLLKWMVMLGWVYLILWLGPRLAPDATTMAVRVPPAASPFPAATRASPEEAHRTRRGWRLAGAALLRPFRYFTLLWC